MFTSISHESAHLATLVGMPQYAVPTGPGLAPVISLGAARKHHRSHLHSQQPSTVILRTSNLQADREVHRHIGINADLHLNDLHRVIDTCFELPGAGEGDDSEPWYFSLGTEAEQLDRTHRIRKYLGEPGQQLLYHWGLWSITIETIDNYPRDTGTPQALCVGGSGGFDDRDFNPSIINARLTGKDTIRRVLSQAVPNIRRIIERTRLFDFVALLQAIDLSREVSIAPEAEKICCQLPLETEPRSIDAFWSTILGLSCLSGDELGDEVTETTMAALGWGSPEGGKLAGPDIRELCSDSLQALSSIGAYRSDALSMVDRLDIYRRLLRGA